MLLCPRIQIVECRSNNIPRINRPRGEEAAQKMAQGSAAEKTIKMRKQFSEEVVVSW